jgi:ribosome-binding factor A
MSSVRMQRVRELVIRALSEILRREMPVAELGLASVNDVDIAKDLQSATVYVGLVGTREQQRRAEEFLGRETKRLQGELGRAIVLRYTPKLKFVHDHSIERGNRILSIIEELEKAPPKE